MFSTRISQMRHILVQTAVISSLLFTGATIAAEDTAETSDKKEIADSKGAADTKVADRSEAAVEADAKKAPSSPSLWTGFYFGANAGGAWTARNTVDLFASPGPCDPAFAGCAAAPSLLTSSLANGAFRISGTDGFLGGGQVGYIEDAFLAGMEADIQGLIGSGGGRDTFLTAIQDPNFVDIYTQALTIPKSLDYDTVHGRLGDLATPKFLLYGRAGLSFGGANSRVDLAGAALDDPTLPFPYFATAKFFDTRVGWTAGAGVERLFWSSRSAKAEYLFYDLGRAPYPASSLIDLGGPLGVAPGGVYSSAFPFVLTRFDGHIMRAAVNDHLDFAPPPVAARY
jgi:outer membrane immunogenic protein